MTYAHAYRPIPSLEPYEPIEEWLFDWTIERKLLGYQAEGDQ